MKKRLLIVGVLSLFLLTSFKGVVFGKENRIFSLFSYWAKKTEEIIENNKVRPPESIRGIYMTAHTMGSNRANELIENLLKNGGNAVVIDIEHGSGLLAFEPKNEFLKNINPGSSTLNNLPEIIDELHKKGVYVIARQVVFSDPYIGERKPEWRIKKRWGGLYDYRWLDPSKPGAQNYNLYIMQEIAKLGFDEIQFDYIRFPAANHSSLNYHYDEDSFARSDIINDFLRKAKWMADYYGMRLSVDVFGVIVWGNIDWKNVGQNAGEMAKYVDAIYPMTYPSHYDSGFYGHPDPHNKPYGIIYDSIERFVKEVDGNAEIRPWIQGFPLKVRYFGTWFMEEQIKAAFDAGANDFTIWSPGNYYTYSWPTFSIEPEEKELAKENTTAETTK